MSVLGAVLAGGKSSRFGSDKAIAMLGNATLIEHVLNALRRQCDAVVVVGRRYGGAPHIEDLHECRQGPLGGIAAALQYALANKHGEVLSCGVDSLGIPDGMVGLLAPAPAYVANQPVVGLWPVEAIDAARHLLDHGQRSMTRFAGCVGARAVHLANAPANINTPDDLARLEPSDGL